MRKYTRPALSPLTNCVSFGVNLLVERTRVSCLRLPEGVVCTAAVLHIPSAGSLTSPPWSVENSGRRGDVCGEGEGQ